MCDPIDRSVVKAYRDFSEAYSSGGNVRNGAISASRLVKRDDVGDGLSPVQAVKRESEDIVVLVVGIACDSEVSPEDRQNTIFIKLMLILPSAVYSLWMSTVLTASQRYMLPRF
jgi:hypothetical protein